MVDGVHDSKLAALDEWDDEERSVLVALLRARPEGLTWPHITARVAERGSARPLWDEFYPAGLFSMAVGQGSSPEEQLDAARADVRQWRDADFTFMTFKDERYPAQLRDVHQLPPVLFAKGLLRSGDRGISVVGSRNASHRGLEFARNVAVGLSRRGVSVLSGLARGIDSAVHESTLQADGRTVAVVGTGIQKVYPAENADLLQRIVDNGGLVLSQFWPDSPPSKQTFPMRNATMSAYGMATIVVEAGEHSGARIQARVAVAHGRPVILTSFVLESTKWGPSLLGQPGVFHAKNESEAVGMAMDAASASDELSQFRELIVQ